MEKIQTSGKAVILLLASFAFGVGKYVVGLFCLGQGFWQFRTNEAQPLSFVLAVLAQLAIMWVAFVCSASRPHTKEERLKTLILFILINFIGSLIFFSLLNVFLATLEVLGSYIILMAVIDVIPNTLFIILLAYYVNRLKLLD